MSNTEDQQRFQAKARLILPPALGWCLPGAGWHNYFGDAIVGSLARSASLSWGGARSAYGR